MVSQLYVNDKVSFIAAKPFQYRDTYYELGDDFDQEEARSIETLVRAHYVIPVVDSLDDKPPTSFFREIQVREEALERLRGDKTQIVLPEQLPESEQGVEAEAAAENAPSEAGEEEVPEGTANEIMDWVGDDPERAQRALDAETAPGGRNRSTLIAKLEAKL